MTMRTARRIAAAGIVLLCLTAGILHSVYQSKYDLEVSYYTVKTNRLSDLRVVQLSDLHNSTFGEHNKELIEQVKTQLPDLIFLTGDILNGHEKETDTAVRLIEQLSGIAPVYFSYGNQEKEYESYYDRDLKPVLESAGANILDFDYQDITIKGEKLRIGGIYAYCLPEKYLETGEAKKEECDFINRLQNTDIYTILLCHMPVSWLINDGLEEWDVDCVFSGHAHGGEVILPKIGGLYAPDMGWFPGKLCGIYASEDGRKKLILSRGLGTSERIPRFNNIPEIVVVDLQPREQ